MAEMLPPPEAPRIGPKPSRAPLACPPHPRPRPLSQLYSSKRTVISTHPSFLASSSTLQRSTVPAPRFVLAGCLSAIWPKASVGAHQCERPDSREDRTVFVSLIERKVLGCPLLSGSFALLGKFSLLVFDSGLGIRCSILIVALDRFGHLCP